MNAIWPGLVAAIAGLVVLALLWRMLSRPATLLYALAFVVSLVGINVHVGATIYLSRLIFLWFIVVLIVRRVLQIRNGPRLRVDGRVVALFSGTIVIHTISSLASESPADSFRQMFIYLGAMAIFFMVLALGDSTAKIIRALKFYLVSGVVQGLYGVYQVAGGPRGWPTYQSLLADVPTANDRTQGGYIFSGDYQVFRAFGFFPGDVSHYAGYLAGVLLIALALIGYGRRTVLPYLVVLAAGAGLLFSLSRSGIVAFTGIGLPVLGYLLWSRRLVSRRRIVTGAMKPVAVSALLLALGVGTFGAEWWSKNDLPDVWHLLALRLGNLIPGDDSPAFESMALHIESRTLALDALRSSPLIGVGLGVTARPWHSARYDTYWSGAHSHHFNILGQTGLLGATLEWTFMAFVFIQMRRGLEKSRPHSEERAMMIGLLAAYVTLLIGNFFYTYYTNDFVWFLMASGWALSRAIRREAGDRGRAQVHPSPGDLQISSSAAA